MQSTDLTIVILRGIREDVQSVRSEIRVASDQLEAVVGAMREVRELLRGDLALRAEVEDHGRRIAALEVRVG